MTTLLGQYVAEKADITLDDAHVEMMRGAEFIQEIPPDDDFGYVP